jgi:hypothetical protein
MNNRRRIIPPRHGVEVVVEDDGCISIQQIDDGFHSDEPVVVRFHPNDVPQLIDLLDEALIDALIQQDQLQTGEKRGQTRTVHRTALVTL